MSVLVDRTVMELVNLHGYTGSMDLGTVIVVPSDVLDLMEEVERLRAEPIMDEPAKLIWVEMQTTILEQRVQAERLREALTLILDMVDYTAGNCRLNEQVGAVLPKGVIEQARGALSHE